MNISEVLAASIIRAMEAAWTSETLVNWLHDDTTQKTAIFVLTAVRTSNPTQWQCFSVWDWRVRVLAFNKCKIIQESYGSSGSIVSDYGLGDRVIEVRSPTGAEDVSSSPCVQIGSEAHPASYPMGTGSIARPGRDADHSPPSSGRG
jgi:hypothetical protein